MEDRSIKHLYVKICARVCDKVVCERCCVTKLLVKDAVRDVCDKGVCVCERWCVTKMVCETWCVTKMVCDKAVCERFLCERWCVKDGA